MTLEPLFNAHRKPRGVHPIQGYLGHQKQRPPRALQYKNASGPVAALGGGAFSYDQDTPVRAVRFSAM